MNAHAAPPSFLGDRRRVASIRSSQPPDRPTARPAATLADVVRLARDRPTPVALDAPKVQARNRVYLPACLGALGWDHGTDLRVHVDAGHGVLTAGPGRGATVRVGSNHRITLPDGKLTGLGADVGGHLVAVVPPDGGYVLLVGPAGFGDVVDLLTLPPHVRDLVAGVGSGLTVGTARAVAALCSRLTEADLVALAGTSVERLRELGVVGGDLRHREVR